MTVTRDIGSHAAPLIALAAAASSTYDAFVYDDGAQAGATHELLFAAGASEFSPPFAALMIEHDQLTAMAAAMTAQQINDCRLRAALCLSRAPWFARGSAPRRRAQTAGQTFMPLESGDFYLSRLAVLQTARGKGCAKTLLEQMESDARRAGAGRLALDVSPDHEAAIHLYIRCGFEKIGQGEAKDDATGRTLIHLHMVKKL